MSTSTIFCSSAAWRHSISGRPVSLSSPANEIAFGLCRRLVAARCEPALNRTMLSQLATTLRNYRRAILSLRHRLLRKARESEQKVVAKHCREQEVVAKHCLVHATKRVDDRPFARTGKQEAPTAGSSSGRRVNSWKPSSMQKRGLY